MRLHKRRKAGFIVKRTNIFSLSMLAICLLLCCGGLYAENIDPYEDGSQYAYGENVGWLNFEPNIAGDDTDYGVTIDWQGNFDGWAWGENIGWIHFQSATPVAYKVQVCKVSFEDFANFALYWLDSGAGLPADLDNLGDVNINDLRVFAI